MCFVLGAAERFPRKAKGLHPTPGHGGNVYRLVSYCVTTKNRLTWSI